MIQKAIRILKARGIAGLIYVIHSRMRGLLAGQARSFSTHRNDFVGRSGLEIGGPSQVFSRKGIFPIYPLIENLDNFNFSETTTWGGVRHSGQTFCFDPDKPVGRQYIVEASNPGQFQHGCFDFVLSSHVLEHIANPIQALNAWKDLLSNKGLLVLVLPDKRHTFDHRRPVTSIEHLIEDFNVGTTEDDLSHLPEIMALHDLKRDWAAGDMQAFQMRSARNREYRCLHHHVFDRELAVQLVEYVGLRVVSAEEVAPHHILLVAQKTSVDASPPLPDSTSP